MKVTNFKFCLVQCAAASRGFRVAWGRSTPLSREVDVDEKYMGGRKGKMHVQDPHLDGSREPVARWRWPVSRNVNPSHHGQAGVLHHQWFAAGLCPWMQGLTVYTDKHPSYESLSTEFIHEAVQDCIGEYVCQAMHTNDIEVFWSLEELAYIVIHDKPSTNHIEHQLRVLASKHNLRALDTGEHGTDTMARRKAPPPPLVLHHDS